MFQDELHFSPGLVWPESLLPFDGLHFEVVFCCQLWEVYWAVTLYPVQMFLIDRALILGEKQSVSKNIWSWQLTFNHFVQEITPIKPLGDVVQSPGQKWEHHHTNYSKQLQNKALWKQMLTSGSQQWESLAKKMTYRQNHSHNWSSFSTIYSLSS